MASVTVTMPDAPIQLGLWSTRCPHMGRLALQATTPALGDSGFSDNSECAYFYVFGLYSMTGGTIFR